jgi:hypothetical protein
MTETEELILGYLSVIATGVNYSIPVTVPGFTAEQQKEHRKRIGRWRAELNGLNETLLALIRASKDKK